MRFLFSLHDVCPFHLERVKKAQTLFQDWGLKKVSYLIVPDFHEKGRADQQLAFCTFCQEPVANLQRNWMLHGYLHLDTDVELEVELNWRQRWKRKYATAAEGEFSAITPDVIYKKINKGIEIYRNIFSEEPDSFVAPAWLFHAGLVDVLKAENFKFTEDHCYIYDLQSESRIKAPVVTWATRNWYMKYGSLLVCPLLYKKMRKEDVIRIAVHPWDFDHPETVQSIKNVVKKALGDGVLILPEDL